MVVSSRNIEIDGSKQKFPRPRFSKRVHGLDKTFDIVFKCIKMGSTVKIDIKNVRLAVEKTPQGVRYKRSNKNCISQIFKWILTVMVVYSRDIEIDGRKQKTGKCRFEQRKELSMLLGFVFNE